MVIGGLRTVCTLVKDVVFQEDTTPLKHHNAASSLSLIRNIVINVARRHGYDSRTIAERFLCHNIDDLLISLLQRIIPVLAKLWGTIRYLRHILFFNLPCIFNSLSWKAKEGCFICMLLLLSFVQQICEKSGLSTLRHLAIHKEQKGRDKSLRKLWKLCLISCCPNGITQQFRNRPRIAAYLIHNPKTINCLIFSL